jgi:outer membrane receptor for ferrienterochelin and colicins
MSTRRTIAASPVLLLALATAAAAGQSVDGRIEGRVTRGNGQGVSGVTVILGEGGPTTFTDDEGVFRFVSLAEGTYSITLTLGSNSEVASDIHVMRDQTTRVDTTVAWESGFVDEIIVHAASRRIEKIAEAPAAVSVVTAVEIERNAATGQLPKLLEFTPGAEVTQSGVYDFNINTRGFNSSLNRRVATFIDGRDPSIPLLGAQEWASMSFPLDDIASLEFVRGPSAALYGANASSGVLNMLTKPPRYSQGGLLRFTAGELATSNADFRWAGDLGRGWFAKALGGIRKSDDFSRSRNGAAEYSVPCPPRVTGDCLPQEAVPILPGGIDVWLFSGRLDKYASNGALITMEGGFADISGPILQTGVGRTQSSNIHRPWGRFNLSTDRWNLLTYYNRRTGSDIVSLGSGSLLSFDDQILHAEAQRRDSFARDRVNLISGTSYRLVDLDSFDPNQGMQTILSMPVQTHHGAAYSQVEWTLNDKTKLIAAGRFDASDLHASRFSPRGSIVHNLTPRHGLRLTFNVAYQGPSHAEAFLRVTAAPPVDLTALNGACTAVGVDCGLGPTSVVAAGNDSLGVEETQTFEIGYKGLIEDRTWVTVDYYRSQANNFITDLLPQLGTSAGRINPDFGPWVGPPSLPAEVTAAIRRAVPLLTNDPADGSNVIVAASYTTFGDVDTQGVDVALSHARRRWTFTASYSWFDFDIKDVPAGLDTLVLPNTPEHKASFGVSYVHTRWNAAASMRWVDRFRWSVGPFLGNVDAYKTVDLVANYSLNEHWSVGANISNLLDNEHWESFGGDLLRRRALTQISYTW